MKRHMQPLSMKNNLECIEDNEDIECNNESSPQIDAGEAEALLKFQQDYGIQLSNIRRSGN